MWWIRKYFWYIPRSGLLANRSSRNSPMCRVHSSVTTPVIIGLCLNRPASRRLFGTSGTTRPSTTGRQSVAEGVSFGICNMHPAKEHRTAWRQRLNVPAIGGLPIIHRIQRSSITFNYCFWTHLQVPVWTIKRIRNWVPVIACPSYTTCIRSRIIVWLLNAFRECIVISGVWLRFVSPSILCTALFSALLPAGCRPTAISINRIRIWY